MKSGDFLNIGYRNSQGKFIVVFSWGNAQLPNFIFQNQQ